MLEINPPRDDDNRDACTGGLGDPQGVCVSGRKPSMLRNSAKTFDLPWACVRFHGRQERHRAHFPCNLSPSNPGWMRLPCTPLFLLTTPKCARKAQKKSDTHIPTRSRIENGYISRRPAVPHLQVNGTRLQSCSPRNHAEFHGNFFFFAGVADAVLRACWNKSCGSLGRTSEPSPLAVVCRLWTR